nr:helix-turn-helix domain-containing protein [Sphingomonas laterariae]
MEQDENQRARIARAGNPFLNTAQAAHHLGVSIRLLERMRRRGEGPLFRRHGRHVRYHVDDLDSWSRQSGNASGLDTRNDDGGPRRSPRQ